MIKILNIQEAIGSGGVERRRLSLAKYLDKTKVKLKIICTAEKDDIANLIRAENVEVICIGDLSHPFDWQTHKKVQKIIDEFKPHIIHGAVFEGVTMAAINGFIKNVPIIIIEETSDPQNRSWRGNLLMKFFSLTADKLIGVSPASTDYLISKLKIPKHKVQLINNGVALPRYVSESETSKVKRDYKISSDELVIGSIGRMHQDENKRFSDLIKAFGIVVKKGIKAKLILVGEGKEMANYVKLVDELDLKEKVIFTGYQSDVALYYSCFDIFSLVSAYESFGLVLAEAMLHKLPVVATRVGGMKYIVDHNETGFLVGKFNTTEIADKLIKLCKSKQLRTEFGENGYLKANQNYTEEIYVKNVESLYFKLALEKNIS